MLSDPFLAGEVFRSTHDDQPLASAYLDRDHVAHDLLPEANARVEAIGDDVPVLANGGSTTGCQVLAEGRPVLGLASNLDQYLAMTAIADAGAGLLLRAGNLDRHKSGRPCHAA